jgi:hypothetical protein
MPQTDTTIAALHREGIQTDSSKKNRVGFRYTETGTGD